MVGAESLTSSHHPQGLAVLNLGSLPTKILLIKEERGKVRKVTRKGILTDLVKEGTFRTAQAQTEVKQ